MQPNQFQLEKQRATLVKINPRSETHGDEKKPAADLFIQITDDNGMLAMFHPVLRSTFYKVDESQGQLDGVDRMSVRRFGGLIEKLGLDYSLKGADVEIGFGVGGPSDITMQTVDVDKFKVTLMEGGTVVVLFRIKGMPTGEQIKKLYEIMGGEIDITVTPAIEKQGSLGLPTDVE